MTSARSLNRMDLSVEHALRVMSRLNSEIFRSHISTMRTDFGAELVDLRSAPLPIDRPAASQLQELGYVIRCTLESLEKNTFAPVARTRL
jgi:hypothetical protein